MVIAKLVRGGLLILLVLSIPVFAQARSYGKTTAETLNVRSKPEGQVVGSLPKNTVVTILSSRGGWVKILSLSQGQKGVIGWVSEKYIEKDGNQSNQEPSSISAVAYDQCESEYKTGAEVCIKVSNATLDCSESLFDDYYDNCAVDVTYILDTDYKGGVSISTDVTCEAEISYESKDSFVSSNLYENTRETHDVYAYANDRHYVNMSFSFGTFDEVLRVKLNSFDCRIDNVELY